MKKDFSLIKNNADMQVRLQRLHLEFGKQQGLAFYEKDYKGKNYLLYKMELYQLTEKSFTIFEWHISEMTQEQLDKYNCLEQENITAKDIIADRINDFEKTYIFPLQQNALLDISLMLYHVITYLQDIEKNSIWMSLVINAYLREQLLATKYYISYARIIVKNKQKIESVIKKVKKNNDLGIWIDFFLELLLEGVRRTNKIIETIILINLDVNAIISKEKAKNMLPDVMLFIEKYPVFDIRDIEKELGISYNTAAKNVAILEKQNIVCEISHRQRNRLYMYRQYMEELLDS